MTSYVSTGGGGIDYEVDVAAASLAQLLTETTDRLTPDGFTPKLVGLQDRTGPAGLDDVCIIAVDKAGDELKIFVQARRHFSFAARGDFPALV
jgi:hypothetical protein